ncbi:type I DNA topoisomerase [Spirochaeta cellobiosiphila]|uniref:type I DNA topoisomerase n=1 Tax=Spirochaeta cellobiosiphila TaxID=504483 RepID=UPI0003FDFBC3|nr:type I DNA topoisomerase [Spirochaeta cellobiosiphila]
MAKKSTGKNLLIVESPAKAKTIKKFLGSGFDVKASVGHIRDLSKKGRGGYKFGINVKGNFDPDYIVISGKEKVIEELKTAASKASHIYLAPDPDREGEAIAWHLKEVIGASDENVSRITYQAVTKKAVQTAIENPRKIDQNLVDAQQGRRVLDRLVGFQLSPFLWKKVCTGLSAGRVQSVAVKMVVEKEREIQAFVPEEYWKIIADLNKEGQSFKAQLVNWKDTKFVLGGEYAKTEEMARAVEEALKKADYVVISVEEKENSGRPSPPFITSTLQQAASSQLRFGTSKTMRVAQTLYEGIELDGGPVGLITYMRTDSTRIDPEAIDQARDFITQNYDKEYLPEKAPQYTTKKNAQDAHEAIRPTYIDQTPEKVKPFLSADQFKLYDLIWKRFLASQMAPSRSMITTAKIEAADGILEAKGRRVVFRGHTVLQPEEPKKEDDIKDQILPPLGQNDKVDLDELSTTQHFTKPPARYSEASLVRALEKEGIGRPSTYAPIIATIKDRGYVWLEKRAFHASELGMAVTDMLEAGFSDIMNKSFTADMEGKLDNIESGNTEWVNVIKEFYEEFLEELDVAMDKVESLKGREWDGDEKCPLCGSSLVVRYSKKGAFLGCSNYPECKGLLPMPGEGDEDGQEEELKVDCPTCGKPMLKKSSRYGSFLACSGYPECKTTLSLDKDGNIVELPHIERTCDKCGKPMAVKTGRRGMFLACTGYPECSFTLPMDKNGNVIELPKVEEQTCEKCGSPMVVRMSRRGPFLGCSNYPKCRNAKPLPKDGTENEEGTEK